MLMPQPLAEQELVDILGSSGQLRHLNSTKLRALLSGECGWVAAQATLGPSKIPAGFATVHMRR